MEDSYYLDTTIKDDSAKMEMFNDLMQNVFNFSFRDWEKDHPNKDKFFPLFLWCGNHIVATAYLFYLTFTINNEKTVCLQVGGVHILPPFQGQGITYHLFNLLEKTFEADVYFLYAVEEAQGLYEKLGYHAQASDYYRLFIRSSLKYTYRHLDYAKDKSLLQTIICQNQSLSIIDDLSSHELKKISLPFNAADYYFDAKEQVLLMAHFSEDMLYVDDIYSREVVNIYEVIGSLLKKDQEVTITFPLNEKGAEFVPSPEHLFIKAKRPFRFNFLVPVLLKS